jgi:hypothetical protein
LKPVEEVMTGRERLLCSFGDGAVDRPAVSPFIHENFVRAFYHDPQTDVVAATVEVYGYFGFDLMHRNVPVRFEPPAFDAPAWRVEVTEEREGAAVRQRTTVTTPERTLTQVVRFEEISPYQRVKAVVKNFIGCEEDFAQFRRYQPELPRLDFSGLKRAARLVGDRGVVAPWTWGLFNYAADLRGLDRLLEDMLIRPDFYRALMELCLAQLTGFHGQLAAAGVDVLSYPGNMANGTMVGPALFRAHVLPYEQRLIRFIQDRGVPVLYHNCGDARAMIEAYNELGIRGFETLTEPPYGDMDLEDALGRFDRRITLIGNVDQIRFLRQAGPADVRRKAAEILERVGARGRFILGTSDFLEEGTPNENLFALAEAGRAGG